MAKSRSKSGTKPKTPVDKKASKKKATKRKARAPKSGPTSPVLSQEQARQARLAQEEKERVEARKQRAERKAQRVKDLANVPPPAVVAPNGAATPPASPPEPAADGEDATVMAGDSAKEAAANREELQAEIDKIKKGGVEYLPLNENDSIKLELYERRVDSAREVVSDPIFALLQAQMNAEITAVKQKWETVSEAQLDIALLKDEKYLEAHKKHIDAVNKVITKMTASLKANYSITVVEPEEQRVHIKFLPNQRGRLFDHLVPPE